jgi:hypothetical protein
VASPSGLSFLAAPLASSGSAWVAPTIVISVVALGVSVATFFLAGRRARLDRQRQVFADAFEVVMEYREYPFIVRRRSPDDRAGERRRISGDLSQVQAKLNAFKARLRVEAPFVGDRYAELVASTRRAAGALIIEAWNSEPVGEDENINSPGWDLSELDAHDDAYLRAVADHLGWMYAPVRRKLRLSLSRPAPAVPKSSTPAGPATPKP